MPYIVVDTCVFTRLDGIYRVVLGCFLGTDDVIAYSKEVLNEYKGRAPDLLILMGFITRLTNAEKIKMFKRSYIDSHVKRYSRVRRINYPSHNRDRKWVNIAIAVIAKYIISTDSHLLNILPNHIENDIIKIIKPSQYMEIRCS